MGVGDQSTEAGPGRYSGDSSGSSSNMPSPPAFPSSLSTCIANACYDIQLEMTKDKSTRLQFLGNVAKGNVAVQTSKPNASGKSAKEAGSRSKTARKNMLTQLVCCSKNLSISLALDDSIGGSVRSDEDKNVEALAKDLKECIESGNAATTRKVPPVECFLRGSECASSLLVSFF